MAVNKARKLQLNKVVPDLEMESDLENQTSVHQVWLPIIGKALARLALENSPSKNSTTADKAKFLEGLGLARKDAAEILGTTAASITELLRQAKNKRGKGGKRRG